MLVDDQIPITAAPNEANTSDSLTGAGPEHEEGDRREEERPQHSQEPVERRARHHLQVEREADREDAREPGGLCESAARVGRDVSHPPRPAAR